MKVPLYVDDLLNRRVRTARAYVKATERLISWYRDHNIPLPADLDLYDIHEPVEKGNRLRQAILEPERSED